MRRWNYSSLCLISESRCVVRAGIGKGVKPHSGAESLKSYVSGYGLSRYHDKELA